MKFKATELKPHEQEGGLSECEEEDEITLSQPRERLRDKERPEVEPESNEELQRLDLKPHEREEEPSERKEEDGIPLSQTQERAREEEKLEIEPELSLKG